LLFHLSHFGKRNVLYYTVLFKRVLFQQNIGSGQKKTILKNALARPAILLLPSGLSDEPGMNGAGMQQDVAAQ